MLLEGLVWEICLKCRGGGYVSLLVKDSFRFEVLGMIGGGGVGSDGGGRGAFHFLFEMVGERGV